MFVVELRLGLEPAERGREGERERERDGEREREGEGETNLGATVLMRRSLV